MKSRNSARSSSSDLWSSEMLFTTATRGAKLAIEPSLSSTSLTKMPPSPTRALAIGRPPSMKFFMSAPFMIVGRLPARSRIQPIMPTVVDLPLVPATPTLKSARLNSSASSFARVMMVAPTRRAACTSGTVSSTAVEVTRIWSAAADAAAVLRVQHDPAAAQEIESFGVASLVERAVGAFHPSAARLDDQGERSHAATADAAEKVVFGLGHRRYLQALPRRTTGSGLVG